MSRVVVFKKKKNLLSDGINAYLRLVRNSIKQVFIFFNDLLFRCFNKYQNV